METIFLQNGETLFKLSCGIDVFFYNVDTPLLFKDGCNEIGRIVSDDPSWVIECADKVSKEDILEYFNKTLS